MGMEADYNWDQRNNPCFEETESTTYEEDLELLYQQTGECYCNLCKALKINGWKELGEYLC